MYLFYEFSLPLGCKVDDENEYYLIYKAENLHDENINKLKSVSQISEVYVEPISNEEDDEKDTSKTKSYTNVGPKFVDNSINKHNISLPFEIETLYHNAILNVAQPKMLIQINSCDSYNRHRIEGYCYINIPIQTGFYQYEIPCYKPKEDNYMKVFSYFLGGSRKIPDLREIARICSKDENNVDTVLNRYGISTEYVGKVNINLNVVVQSKSVQIEARSRVKERQSREAYNFITQIEQQNINAEEKVEEKNIFGNTLMQTKSHGMINRYSK